MTATAKSELLAFDSSFSVGSSFFSSFFNSVGSAFSSFSGRVSSFFASGGCVFRDCFGVCSHCFVGAFDRFSGFAASSEAQSRGSDGSSQNELTHNYNSLFSEWNRCSPDNRPAPKPEFSPRLCVVK